MMVKVVPCLNPSHPLGIVLLPCLSLESVAILGLTRYDSDAIVDGYTTPKKWGQLGMVYFDHIIRTSVHHLRETTSNGHSIPTSIP